MLTTCAAFGTLGLMFLPAPLGFRDPALVDERLALLETAEHIQPLREFAADLIRRRQPKQPDIVVPHFDPADAGVDAKVLLLLFEAPGPKTVAEWGGSGFISSDNDDPSAENVWRIRDQVGMHDGVIAWNIVPWLLGPSDVKPDPVELGQGGMELRRLLPLLPKLRAVVLGGLKSQEGWNRFVDPNLDHDFRIIPTWHPSRRSFRQPGKREEFTRAMERAAALAL